jgi:hypothetical protein
MMRMNKSPSLMLNHFILQNESNEAPPQEQTQDPPQKLLLRVKINRKMRARRSRGKRLKRKKMV